MSENVIAAYVAGFVSWPIVQYAVLPWMKRYWGIKDKPKKSKKNDDSPRVTSKGKTYEIHVHLPKDEEDKKD